jgi:DNA topoisomerase IB
MRLKHVASDALTIERRRHGKGFAYLRPDGRRVRDDQTRQRARDLVIPPAWTELAGTPSAPTCFTANWSMASPALLIVSQGL